MTIPVANINQIAGIFSVGIILFIIYANAMLAKMKSAKKNYVKSFQVARNVKNLAAANVENNYAKNIPLYVTAKEIVNVLQIFANYVPMIHFVMENVKVKSVIMALA